MSLHACEYCWDHCGGYCDTARSRKGLPPLSEIQAKADKADELKALLIEVLDVAGDPLFDRSYELYIKVRDAI
jgi:hypothetical protein